MGEPQAPGAPTAFGWFNIWWALALAIPCGSTAVLFIKASHYPPVWMAAFRLLLSSLMLAPLAMRDVARRGVPWHLGDARASFIPALALAFHFATWIIGARLSPAVDASLIGNLLPAAMPLVALVLLREWPSGSELLAGCIGVAGVLVLLLLADRHGSTQAEGDALCGVSLVGVAAYLALARRQRRGSLFIYLTPLYGMAGLVCVLAALAMDGPPPLPSPREALLILGLAAIPTVIAHSIYNRAMTELRPNTLGVLNLMQCPIAGITAWLLWGEHPPRGLYLAALSAVLAIAGRLWPALPGRLAARPA